MDYMYCLYKDNVGCALVNWKYQASLMSLQNIVSNMQEGSLIVENMRLVSTGKLIRNENGNKVLAVNFPEVEQKIRDYARNTIINIIEEQLGPTFRYSLKPINSSYKFEVENNHNKWLTLIYFFERAVMFDGGRFVDETEMNAYSYLSIINTPPQDLRVIISKWFNLQYRHMFGLMDNVALDNEKKEIKRRKMLFKLLKKRGK